MTLDLHLYPCDVCGNRVGNSGRGSRVCVSCNALNKERYPETPGALVQTQLERTFGNG